MGRKYKSFRWCRGCRREAKWHSCPDRLGSNPDLDWPHFCSKHCMDLWVASLKEQRAGFDARKGDTMIDATKEERDAIRQGMRMAAEICGEIGWTKPFNEWTEEQFHTLVEAAITGFSDHMRNTENQSIVG